MGLSTPKRNGTRVTTGPIERVNETREVRERKISTHRSRGNGGGEVGGAPFNVRKPSLNGNCKAYGCSNNNVKLRGREHIGVSKNLVVDATEEAALVRIKKTKIEKERPVIDKRELCTLH